MTGYIRVVDGDKRYLMFWMGRVRDNNRGEETGQVEGKIFDGVG